MIDIEHLTKVYDNGKEKVTALNDISLKFEDTGLVFIVGKSGCGKTTLLNLLGALDRPTEGSIVVDGKAIEKMKNKEFDSYRNDSVGFVFQEYNLIDNYNVGVNIALALELKGKRADKTKIEEVLRQLELVDQNGKTLYEKKINELSGGQKQRVAIARALIKNPSIILADEPTGALDSTTSKSLYQLLADLSKNRLIIVVSHDEMAAETFADRIIKLSDGKVVEDIVKRENKD